MKIRGYEKGGMVKYGKGIHAVAPYFSVGRNAYVRGYLRNKSNSARPMTRAQMTKKMNRFADEIRFFDDDAHRFARLKESGNIIPRMDPEASGIHLGELRKMQRFERNLLRYANAHHPLPPPQAAPQVPVAAGPRKRGPRATARLAIQAGAGAVAGPLPAPPPKNNNPVDISSREREIEQRRLEGQEVDRIRQARAQERNPPPSPPRAEAPVARHYTEREILDMVAVPTAAITETLRNGAIQEWVTANPQLALKEIDTKRKRLRDIQAELKTWVTLPRKTAKKRARKYKELAIEIRALQIAYEQSNPRHS